MFIVVIMGKWSDDNACLAVHNVRLYSVLVLCLTLWLVCLCYVVRVADDIYY